MHERNLAAGRRGLVLLLALAACGAPDAKRPLSTSNEPADAAKCVGPPTELRPGLRFSPASRDFSFESVGEATSRAMFELENVSGQRLDALQFAVCGDFELTDQGCAALKPDEACSVSVRFRPSAEGRRTGKVVAWSAGFGGDLALSGEGRGYGTIVATPASHDFAVATVGERVGIDVTLENVHPERQVDAVRGMLTGPDADQFAIGLNRCTTPIAPGDSCELELAFKPTSTGLKRATFVDPAVSIDLVGDATAPRLEVLGAVEFGEVYLGASSTQSLEVSNVGDADAHIASPTVSGARADAFRVADDGCSGSPLAAGNVCIMTVEFEPGSTGLNEADLGLSGVLDSVPITLMGTGLKRDRFRALNPPTHDFGVIPPGAIESVVFTVANNAVTPTASLTVSVGGIDASEFNLSDDGCTGVVLSHGDTCEIEVAFSPASAGSRSASLEVETAPFERATAELAGGS